MRAGTKLPLRSTANTGNVALRIPDAAIPRAVVECFGLPITATSANLQGAPECTHAASVRDQIGDRIPLIIDGGPTAHTQAHPPSSISPWGPAAGRFCAKAPFPLTKSSWFCNDRRMRMRRRSNSKQGKWILRAALLLLLTLAVGALAWCRWVYGQIEFYAGQDQAAPADAIGVLGAAEYDGKPSPVYRARLDHARALYSRGIAPLIITLGGGGGDQYSEGAVGREYLMGLGVPESDIIAETQSRNTEDSARRIAVIARANGLRRPGDRQRRHPFISDSRDLRRRGSQRAHLAPAPRLRGRRHERSRPHRPRDSQLHGLAPLSALERS